MSDGGSHHTALRRLPVYFMAMWAGQWSERLPLTVVRSSDCRESFLRRTASVCADQCREKGDYKDGTLRPH